MSAVTVTASYKGIRQKVALYRGMGAEELQSILGVIFQLAAPVVGLLCEVSCVDGFRGSPMGLVGRGSRRTLRLRNICQLLEHF